MNDNTPQSDNPQNYPCYLLVISYRNSARPADSIYFPDWSGVERTLQLIEEAVNAGKKAIIIQEGVVSLEDFKQASVLVQSAEGAPFVHMRGD